MKKRLLFVVHSLNIGGTERLVFHMARVLKQDYEIGILCLDKKGLMWEECRKEGFFLGQAEREYGFSLNNFSRFNKIIEDFKPDIIHAQQYTPFFFSVIYKIIKNRKIKLIFTEHGRHYPDLVSKKRFLINKFLFKFVDIVTGVSQFTNFSLKKKEGYSGKPLLIYNGFYQDEIKNIEQKSIREELGIDSEVKLIASVGTLRDVKNPLFLLEAFSLLAKKHSGVALVFIGNGPLMGQLENKVIELDLGDRVYLAGERNPATAYYQDLDIFVLPSKSEAASLALLEAMYFGVPAVATNRGGNPELIEHRESGMLVECDDIESLSGTLEELIYDKSLLKKLVKNAAINLDSKFSFEGMIKEYKKIYENLSEKSI